MTHNNKKHTLTAFIAFLITIQCFAANSRFRHLNIDNKIAHTDITCVAQDNSGLMWIATYGGLQSYDGYKLTTYNYYAPSDKIRKLHNRILSLCISDPTLWVGSESGLVSFCIRQNKYIPFTSNQSEDISLETGIEKISNFTDNTIWIKTAQSSAIGVYDEEKKHLQLLEWDKNAKEIAPKLITLVTDKENVWLASNKEIFKSEIIDNKVHLTKVFDKNSLNDDGTFSIVNLYYKNNNLYIRLSNGCYKLPINANNTINLDQSKKLFYSNLVPNTPLYGKAAIDNKGTIWNSTTTGIIQIEDPFTEPKVTHHTYNKSEKNSLSSNYISALFIDRFDRIWIGTWGQGLNYMPIGRSNFAEAKLKNPNNNSVNGSFVKGIDNARNGRVWILTQDGVLTLFSPSKGVISSQQINLPEGTSKHFQCLKYSPNKNKIYIGLVNGLISYNPYNQKAEWIIGSDKKSLIKQAINVYNITEDKHGQLWISSWNHGLLCINDNGNKRELVTHITKDPNSTYCLRTNVVTSTEYFADSNELFVCTKDGLDRFALDNEGKIINHAYYKANESSEHSMSNNFITSLKREDKNTYWVGTLGGGLNKITINSFKNNDYQAEILNETSGVEMSDVENIEIDFMNNIWISGNGIVKIDTKTNKTYKFDKTDGLHGNSFKIGASHTDKRGYMYMGGQNGLTYFMPKELNQLKKNNRLIFTDLHVHSHLITPTTIKNGVETLNNALNYTDKLELHHDQNDFSISFAAVGGNISNRVMYRYRLDGYEADWKENSLEENRAYYSNLDYGKYTFEVQLSNDNGDTWNESSTRKLTIAILPPWWLNPAALAFYIIFLTIITILLIRRYLEELRMKQTILVADFEKAKAEENHQLKLQFFMNISHELKTPLTIILSTIEQLELERNIKNKASEYYESISRNANKLLALINELVDFRKHDIGVANNHYVQLNASDMLGELAEEFVPWSKKKELQLSIENTENIEGTLDKEKLTKVFCNLMSNAIKYTDKGEINVKIAQGKSDKIKPKYRSTYTEYGNEKPFDSLIITVSDSGVGITSASINKIYDRYFQVVNKTSVHLGSGIGLAITKSMVLGMNGNITVSSERQVGTEFIICIPILGKEFETVSAENENENRNQMAGFDIKTYIEDQHYEYEYEEIETTTSDDVVVESDRPTVLLVEDNVELLNNLKNHFSEKYEVLTAENGAIGLELCQKHNPDIVVSDVMMPEMDGMEMCSNIRENLQIAYTPIILLTAKSDVQYQIEGYEAGADMYIPKPFSLKLLDLNIKRLIENKRKMMVVKDEEIIDVENQVEESNELEEENSETRSDIKKNKKKAFIQKMDEFIYANLDNPDLSVNQLCTELFIGRTKLYALVKDECGQSLGDYIRDMRLNRAAHLLKTTDMNITEIIYEVGFGSNSHFSKVFKVRYGITPSEYAKQVNEK